MVEWREKRETKVRAEHEEDNETSLTGWFLSSYSTN